MRKMAFLGLLLICVAGPTATGQTSSPQKPAELAKLVSEAYKSKTLAGLDAKHLAGPVALVIEHSLMEGKNGNGLIKVKQFKNLAAIDKWLNGQERGDGTPFRQTMPLLTCSKAGL
jgi:hypothetical protein